MYFKLYQTDLFIFKACQYEHMHLYTDIASLHIVSMIPDPEAIISNLITVL